jgi:hypothetical protein
MEKMYKEKAGKVDLATLAESVNPHQAKTIFKDTQSLFDAAMAKIEKKVKFEQQKNS